jgi:hypothetical protein
LPKRAATLHLFHTLPHIADAPDKVVLHALEARKLYGSGIGWVDAHLLTSALVSGTPLWTLEARLDKIVRTAGIAHAH